MGTMGASGGDFFVTNYRLPTFTRMRAVDSFSDGKEEGKVEGLAEGEAKGKIEAKLEMIHHLHQLGLSNEQTAQATQLTQAEMEEMLNY